MHLISRDSRSPRRHPFPTESRPSLLRARLYPPGSSTLNGELALTHPPPDSCHLMERIRQFTPAGSQGVFSRRSLSALRIEVRAIRQRRGRRHERLIVDYKLGLFSLNAAFPGTTLFPPDYPLLGLCTLLTLTGTIAGSFPLWRHPRAPYVEPRVRIDPSVRETSQSLFNWAQRVENVLVPRSADSQREQIARCNCALICYLFF